MLLSEKKEKYIEKIDGAYLPYIKLSKLKSLLNTVRRGLLDNNDSGNDYSEAIEDFDNNMKEILGLI